MLNVKGIVCLSFPIAIFIILLIYSDVDVQEANQTRSTSNISIILVIKNTQDLEIFPVAYKTLLCYSLWKKYDFVLMDLSKDNVYAKNCEHNDFFFRRHCATVNYMKDHIETKYVLFIDGDMGVINPKHNIEEYIEPGMDLIFSNRYYNFELMAGSYIAKNSEYARNFLQYWADYNYKLPNSFHGTDNGAIHQVFMDKFAKQDSCQKLWNASKDWGGLWDWEACVRHELGGLDMDTYDNRVKVIKKGQQSWARDGWLTETKWSDRDFLLHGWKQSKQDQGQYDSWIYPFCDDEFNLSLCSDDDALKNWCYKNYLRRSDKEISALLYERDREVRKDYEKTLNSVMLKLKNL